MTQLLSLLMPRPETEEKRSRRVRAGKIEGMVSAERPRSSAKAKARLFGTGRSQAISRKNPKRGREEDHLLQSRTGSSPGHGFLCKHGGR